MPEYDLFISYSHNDKPFVDRLVFDLEQHEIKVWLDQKNIAVGDSMTDSIRKGIDNSKYFAIIISENSRKSEWVKREVDIATNQEIDNKNVKVLPIKVHDCPLPWFLMGKLYADFGKSYSDGLGKLLLRIKPALKPVYELKKLKTIIELNDTKGEKALVTRQRKIRILEGKISKHCECFTVTGSVTRVEAYPTAEIVRNDCGTRLMFHFFWQGKAIQGSEQEMILKFYLDNTFLEKKEFWTLFSQQKLCQSTLNSVCIKPENEELVVMFPASRPPKDYYCIVRSGNSILDPNSFPVKESIDDRYLLRWNIERRSSIYADSDCTLYWHW